jgi:aspartate aminotransferase
VGPVTNYTPSSNIHHLQESATIAASARAKRLRAEGRAIIDLGAGEPDFPTPRFVIEAAHRALDAGATRYTSVAGIEPLRSIIAEDASRTRGAPMDASNVVVSAGTKQALFNACFALFAAGDEVLVPTPGWTSYYEMLTIARATAVPVSGPRDRSFKISAAELTRTRTAKTRGLILNSPSNPTGAVYSRAELEEIVAFAEEAGWWILSDEIYRGICYNGEATSLLAVAPPSGRLVVVDGLAKSMAMPGWRIGWSIGPVSLARSMAALQSHTTSNATTISQHAALSALSDANAYRSALAEMMGELRRRRDGALGILREGGLQVIEPEGAFYLFVWAGRATPDNPEPGARLAERLLDSHDVAVVAGSAFRAPEWIRVSFAAPTADVLEGVRRIVAAAVS